MKPKWQRPLTKTEIKHLRQNGCTTLTATRRNFEAQAKMRQTFDNEPCWECKFIATKLGFVTK